MTLVHEKQLLDALVKSAVEFENKFNKKAQTTPPNFTDYFNLSKKLINQLYQQLITNKTDNKSEVSSKAETSMNISDLTTLGNFLDFIVKNGITVDGQRPVYTSNETPPDTRRWLPVDAELSTFMTESITPEGQRAAFQNVYYVNKDLISKYINNLLVSTANEEPEAQRFLKTMLNGVIQKINKIFRTSLTTDYKVPEKTVANNEVLDSGIPQTFDSQGNGQSGNINLTFADILTPQTLNNWLANNNITIKDNSGKNYTIKDDQFNPCLIINVLHRRSQFRSSRATSQEMKNLADIYMAQIEKIAPQANCQLQQQSQQTVTQSAGLNPTTLQELSSLQPFNSQYINFNEIMRFVDKYATLANREYVNSAKDQIHKSIDMANQVMNTPNLPIRMDNLTTSKFKLLPKQGNQADILAHYLYTIISLAGRVYQDFVSSYEKILGSSAARPLKQQLAGGGPQASNISDIMKIISLLESRSQ